MGTVTKSVTVLLGLSAVGFTSYCLYLLLRKNDDEEDLFASCIPKSRHKTLEIKVPNDLVKSLIGRSGNNIKRIQDLSNTRVNCAENFNSDSSEKLFIIKGSDESCNIAYNLIQDFINNQPILKSEDVWIQSNCVKYVIGRGGEKIVEITSLSGAKLKCINEECNLTSSRIIIKGTQEQINVAKSLIAEVIEQALREKENIENSLAKREPRVPPKFVEVIKNVEVPKSERMSPTAGQTDNQFEIYVSAMENPSKFWIQIVGPKATQLDCLVDEMTDYYNKPENRTQHELEDVHEGDLVAVIFSYDSKWYRAEILEITCKSDENIAKLYYVDYGEVDCIPCKKLCELRTDFLRLHFQAIECFLAIEPAGDSWSTEANDRFEELAHVGRWKKLSAKINGYTIKEKTRAKREGSPAAGVDLYYVSNGQDIDIAKELVKAGYAVYKTQSNSRATSTSNISVASSS